MDHADNDAADDAALPLAGLLVLELTAARAGAVSARHLADWGAEVIRITPPDAEPDAGFDAAPDDRLDAFNLHRGKRHLRLDIAPPDGREVLDRLLERADVLILDGPAAARAGHGLDAPRLRARHPRLVVATVSGFGEAASGHHALADRAESDELAQGMGGLMAVTGRPGGGPMRAGAPVAAMTAGNLLALGVMIALYARATTGRGSAVDTSLLESQIFMLDFQAARYLMLGEVAGQAGNDHPTSAPTGVFPTADGHLNIAAASNKLWATLAAALGHPEWAENPAWASPSGRAADRAGLNAAIGSATITRTAADWFEILNQAGIPAGPIYRIDQLFDDPQVRHLDMAQPAEDPRLGTGRLLTSALNFVGLPRRLPVSC